MERKKMKKVGFWKVYRIVVLVIVVSMLASVFSACGQSQSPDTANTTTASPSAAATPTAAPSKFNALGEFPICKEKITLTIGAPQLTQIKDIDNNKQTLLIEEQGNFELKFQFYPVENFAQAVDLMMASGGSDLPDVLMAYGGFNQFKVDSYAKSGSILPLTKYYNESSYYIKNGLKEIGESFLKYIKSPDGEIYGVLQFSQSLGNEYPAKMWMYQPWLTQLKLTLPKTPEELKNVLKAFKDNDPNGNKKPDEIPLIDYKSGYAIDFLMTPFVYAKKPEYWLVNNGKISVAFNTEEWKQGLKYVNSLVKEELFSPLSLTQDTNQLATITKSEMTVVGSQVGFGIRLAAKDPRIAEYVGVAPLTGSTGQSNAIWLPSLPVINMLITKNCKEPEAAFRLGDLMCSRELTIMTRFGEKGVDWLEPAAGEKALYDALGYKPVLKPVNSSVWTSPQSTNWHMIGPGLRGYDVAAGMVWDGDPLNGEYVIAQAMTQYVNKMPKETVVKLMYTAAENEEISELLNTITTYVKEQRDRFVVGDLDIDKDWDNYIKELEKMKLSRVLQIAQAAYDRSK